MNDKENPGGPKKQRPNKAQVRELVEYMRAHPDLAAGKFYTSNGQAQMQRQWETLATLLNEHGPARNAHQWKVTWRDQKSKARKEGSAHNRAMSETGNGPVPELSDNSVLVLETIGKEMAVGMGRPESGIGFSLPVQPMSAEGEAPVHEAGPSPKLSSSAPQASAAPGKAGPSGSNTTPKRKRKAMQPPERFLSAQLEQNGIYETQLQSLNAKLSCISSTMQMIQRELVKSNRLRRLDIQGRRRMVVDREIVEVGEDEEEVELEEVDREIFEVGEVEVEVEVGEDEEEVELVEQSI